MVNTRWFFSKQQNEDWRGAVCLKLNETSTKAAIKAAKETGDFPQLSKQDVSIIALGIETKGQIITDDFAISNVAKNIGINIAPIMTKGIKDVGKWVHYCPGCKTSFQSGKECSICGTSLKRKLLKWLSNTTIVVKYKIQH